MKFINRRNLVLSSFVIFSLIIIHIINVYYFVKNNNNTISDLAPKEEILENYQYIEDNLDKMEANKDYKESEIIVKFREDKIDLKKFSLLTEKLKTSFFSNLNNVKPIEKLNNLNSLVFQNNNKKTKELIAQLRNNNLIEYVEPNYLFEFANENQENLEKKTDPTQNWKNINSWWVEKIKLKDSWELEQEKPDTQEVLVAVLDQGVDYRHPDLVANMQKLKNCLNENGKKINCPYHGWNFIQNNNQPLPNFNLPFHNHGTSVAGVIGGITNPKTNTTGFSSKNNIKIISLVVGEERASLQAGIDAIYFAQNNKAKVINASWGSPHPNLTLKKAIQDFDGLFIVASMNNGNNNDDYPMYPCNFEIDNLICVGSVNQKNQLSDFSNYSSKFVHLAAPGEQILTTTPNNNYEFIDGTSIAAPQATGLAALIHSYNPFLSSKDVKNIILESGDDLSSLKEKTTTGKIINSYKALTRANQLNQKYQVQANNFYLYFDQVDQENLPILTINNKKHSLKNFKTTMTGNFSQDFGSAFNINLGEKIEIDDYSSENRRNKFRKTIPKNLFTLFSNYHNNQEFNFSVLNENGEKHEIKLEFPQALNAQVFIPLEKNLSLKQELQKELFQTPKQSKTIFLQEPINFGFGQFQQLTQPNSLDLIFLENGFIIETSHPNENSKVYFEIGDKKIYEAVYNNGKTKDENGQFTKGIFLVNIAPDNINTTEYIDKNYFPKAIPENFNLAHQLKANQRTENNRFLARIDYELAGLKISGYLLNQAEMKIYLPDKNLKTYQTQEKANETNVDTKEENDDNQIQPNTNQESQNQTQPEKEVENEALEEENESLIQSLEIKNLEFSPKFNPQTNLYHFDENVDIKNLSLLDFIINSNHQNNEISLDLENDGFELKITNGQKIQTYSFEREQKLWYH